MATPVGHALCGVLVGGLATWKRPLLGPWRDAALFAAVAMGPDLDFLPGILSGNPSAYHHGVSHSLGFAVLAGLVMAWLGRNRGGGAWRWGLAGGLVYFAQVAIDALNVDRSPPFGVPLLWPLWDKYFIADPAWFPDVRRTPLGWPVIWHDIKLVGVELLVWGLPAAALMIYKNRRTGSKAG